MKTKRIIQILIAAGLLLIATMYLRNRQSRLESAGIFLANLNAPEYKYNEQETIYYEGMVLYLEPNGDFYFSKPLSKENDSKGIWDIEGSEIEQSILMTFDNGSTQQTSACSKANCYIELQIPIYLENIIQGYKKIRFEKKLSMK